MSFVEYFSSLRNRVAYSGLLDDFQVLVPSQEVFRVDLVYVRPWPISGMVSTFPFSYTACVRGMGIEETGIGSAATQSLCIQKAISEAYERLVFRLSQGLTRLSTSNGIAAHPSRKCAIANARNELLERDALLTHWLKMSPLIQVKDWQIRVKAISKKESGKKAQFLITHVLFSIDGYISTLSLIARSQQSGDVIFGHGSGSTYEKAFSRAHVELERLATTVNIAERLTVDIRRELEGDFWKHLVFTSDQWNAIQWILGEERSTSDVRKQWRSDGISLLRDFEVIDLAKGNLSVVKVQSSSVQELFFGQTPDAALRSEINWKRIGSEKLNPHRHFVA